MESAARIEEYQSRDFGEVHPEPPGYGVAPELGAMVSRLDEGVGGLLKRIDDLGLDRKTIVLFCSDNGGRHTHASQHPLRKGKGWLYEGGIRVPMIVRWPGKIHPGSINETLTSTIDLLPTLIEMAGLPPCSHPVDGISVAEAMLAGNRSSGKGGSPERTLYWHYPHYHGGSGMKPASALRWGSYKLIEWHEQLLKGEAAWELYDLELDPGESTNFSAIKPELLEQLKKDLDQWRKGVNAQMPVLKNEYDK
jgi:arylsulfatase A-like enzyme